MLNERGGIESDLTAVRLSETRYRLTVGTTSIRRDMSWLKRHLDGERVTLRDCTNEVATLGLMGPDSASIAMALGGGALRELGYFGSVEMEVAGIPVRASRLSYVGEAGWEISCDSNDVPRLWDLVVAAGAAPAGMHAQSSMRIEKRFLSYGHDMDTDTSPLDVGLGFAVGWDTEFIGRDAVLRKRDAGATNRLVTLVLEDADANPVGDEPVLQRGRIIGKTTSAAFGHRIGRPCALAYLGDAWQLADGSEISVSIAGKRCAASVRQGPAFDPAGERMRRGEASLWGDTRPVLNSDREPCIRSGTSRERLLSRQFLHGIVLAEEYLAIQCIEEVRFP